MFSVRACSKCKWARVVLAQIVAACLLCNLSFALAPSSYFSIEDAPVLAARNANNVWLLKIFSIVYETAREKPDPAQAQERLSLIHQGANRYMQSQDSYIVWKRIFHAAGADYFDFEIDQERYRFALRAGHIQDVDEESLAAALQNADTRLPLPKSTRQTTRKERSLLRYSNTLLEQAVTEGRFFAIKDLVHTDLGPFFSGDSQAIAARFAEHIQLTPAQKKSITAKMVALLSNREQERHVRNAFKRLKKTVMALQASGVDGLERRKFVVVIGNGPTPLMYVRTEEGNPINILAHAGKQFSSIYFSLDAIEDYYTFPQAVEAVIRTENSYLEGKDDAFTPEERRMLSRLEEQHIAKHVLAKKAELDKLESEIVKLVQQRKRDKKESNDDVKKRINEKVRALAPNAPIQWHLMGHWEDKDHFLFSAAGRRFYISYDSATSSTATRFEALENLYHLVFKTVGAVIPSVEEAKGLGNTWEDLLRKIAHLSSEYRDRIKRHGRGDIAELLDYVNTLDHSNGYLDDIGWLTERLKAIKVQGNVPAVFVEKPLQELEYTVLQTLAGPHQRGKTPDILEISGIRCKGMQVVGHFHEFVRLPSSKKEKAALLKLARRHGIRDTHAFEQAAPLQDVLERLKIFLGEGPILTYGSMGKVEDLRERMEGGIANQILDIKALAKKVIPAGANYGLPALSALMGMQTPSKEIRGIRLLRLCQHVAGELALRAKHARDAKGLPSEYTRFLARFTPVMSPQVLKDFEKLRQEFPAKVMRLDSWSEISGAIKFTNPLHPDGIQMLVLDYDETIAASKGWIGSDAWFRAESRLKELYGDDGKAFYKLLDRLNRFLTKLGFFELMDPKIPDIIRMAQQKGIHVIVLTARGPWEGHHQLLSHALAKMGIHIPLENIIMTGALDGSGRIFKKEKLVEYCQSPATQKRFNGKFPRIMYVDDGAHYLEKMAHDPSLEPFLQRLVWYQSGVAAVEYRPYIYYLQQAEKILKASPEDGEALPHLLNAFYTSYLRGTADEAVGTGEKVLALLSQFKGDAGLKEEMLGFIRERVREDPELKGALLLRQILKYSAGHLVLFQSLFEDLKKKWGDLGFTEADERYLVQNSRLRAARETMVEFTPGTSAVSGIKILSYREAGNGKSPARAPATSQPEQDRKEYAQGTQAAKAAILRMLSENMQMRPEVAEAINAMGAYEARELFYRLVCLPEQSSPQEILATVEHALEESTAGYETWVEAPAFAFAA